MDELINVCLTVPNQISVEIGAKRDARVLPYAYAPMLPYAYAPMRRAILFEIDRLHRGIGLTKKLSRIFRERNLLRAITTIPPQTF